MGKKVLAQIRKRLRQGAAVALFAVLLVAIPQPASAAEHIPDLQWPAVQVGNSEFGITTGPAGDVTTDCINSNDSVSNLRTYDNTGQLVRELIKANTIDGVENCINWRPAIDKDGDLYGVPDGKRTDGSYGPGPNLLAYSDNTLKWKYPTGCSKLTAPTVGVDGNIYFVSNGRLIGLTPDVQPPLTGPAKILDVPAGINGCAEYLIALEDGIAVMKELRVNFFSYDGTPLGGPLGNAYVSSSTDQISSTGRFFYDSYTVSAGLRSAQISAYDYGRKEVMWTTTVSEQGDHVYGASPHATPDGGTVVYIRQKEMSGGSWTGREAYRLVKLNAFGIKVWSKTLPLSDVSGNKYGGADLVVDTNGNVAILRDAKLKTSNNKLVDAAAITVLDTAGDVRYAETLRGNLDAGAGGLTGYRPDSNQMGIAPNTLYITAQQCNGTYCDGDTKLFPLEVAGLSIDYPRGAIYDATPRPAASYIALGDSFSSGEGVEPFEADTDTPNLNKCHRSEDAYARLLVEEHGAPSLGSDGFRACSGAITANITDAPQWNEGIQLDMWPDPTTELVTVTIGGNDIGFGNFATACVTASCAIGSSAYNTALNEINNTLPGKLEKTYKKILEYAPNAEIYVVGYPHVIANKTASHAFDNRCFYMYDNSNTTNKWAEVQGARDIVTRLNDRIEEKVNDVRALNAGNSRLHFVEVDGATSPFNGREVCGTASSSWFQNVNQDLNNLEYIFHPNSSGQEGYAVVVGAAID